MNPPIVSRIHRDMSWSKAMIEDGEPKKYTPSGSLILASSEPIKPFRPVIVTLSAIFSSAGNGNMVSPVR